MKLCVCVCAFQNQPFLRCPSLRPKLDYDRTDFVARPPGHAGRTGAAERMMTCLGGITADGAGTERRGKAGKERMAACDNAGFMLKGADRGFQRATNHLPLSPSVSPTRTQMPNVRTQTHTRGKLIPLKNIVFYQLFSKGFSEGLCSFLYPLPLPLPLSLFKEESFQTYIGLCAMYSSFRFFIHQRLVRRGPRLNRMCS